MSYTIYSIRDQELFTSTDATSLSDAVSEAVRRHVSLAHANLREADLRGADLRGSYLYSADLTDANLQGANLSSSNLYGAKLVGAYLCGADLSGAYLRSANLHFANLSDANLYDADLAGANMFGTNLTGADVRHSDLASHKNQPLPNKENSQLRVEKKPVQEYTFSISGLTQEQYDKIVALIAHSDLYFEESEEEALEHHVSKAYFVVMPKNSADDLSNQLSFDPAE